MITRVTYRWDNGGWYCETWGGDCLDSDSQKIWFPVDIDSYSRYQAADLEAKLTEAFPYADVEFQE